MRLQTKLPRTFSKKRRRESKMVEPIAKVGIISCSGEEIPEGTISRLAVRRVLEALRPQHTVTLCLPLFLAGEEGERRFAREHPTITVDGCSKLCAKLGTEKYSGQVGASLVVSEILGDRAAGCHRSIRRSEPSRRAGRMDRCRTHRRRSGCTHGGWPQSSESSDTGSYRRACCSCGSPITRGQFAINGKSVTVNGLPLIFQHLVKKGLPPDELCGDQLLETVRIYHPIEPVKRWPTEMLCGLPISRSVTDNQIRSLIVKEDYDNGRDKPTILLLRRSTQVDICLFGAADVGHISDLAARQLTAEGVGKMFCLAGIGGRVSGIMATTQSAKTILAIDGCPLDCARKTLEEAGFNQFEHLRLTDLGMEKGKTPATAEAVAKVVNRAKTRLAG